MKIFNKLVQFKQCILCFVICGAYNHDWEYCKESEHWKKDQYRECKRCGRYEHFIQDRDVFNQTYWKKWNKHCI